MNKQSNNIEYIKYLRVMAAILVMIQHIPIIYTGFQGYLLLIFTSFAQCSVPIFFMISGSLLINHKNTKYLVSFYKKRLLRIGPGIIFWTIVYLSITFRSNPISYTQIINTIISGRPSVHLWFLYVIFMIYIFTPFISKLVLASNKQETVTFLFIVQSLIITSTVLEVHPKYFFIEFILYLGYFLLGYVIVNYNYSGQYIGKKICLLIHILALCGIFFLKFQGIESNLLDGRLGIFTIVMSSSIYSLFNQYQHKFIKNPIIDDIDNLGLGIYTSHILFIIIAFKLLNITKVSNIFEFITSLSLSYLFTVIFCKIFSKIKYLKNIV
jgi:surface polysaccharide O-acyltransferase-like enzyme